MKTYIACDPGKSGAFARIIVPQEGAHHIETWDMPETEKDLLDLVKELAKGIDVKGMLERVNGMPGQSGVAMFTFGRGYGNIRMALISAGIPFDDVSPQKWQAYLGIPKKKKLEKKTTHKNRLKAKAQELYPNVKVTLANADALLIATYLLRISHPPIL